ncbi:MAG TPA: YggS family pyridoxal phosphate-dependent enzyme [Panacibacter sp.]|nr:YggS family pyridoxal phosphate-dependent enzyme [Panacibacter sp.]HNP45730.1 YggS family pyridoxal phosphate-dependent enzyme [Panacibacter sp.]
MMPVNKDAWMALKDFLDSQKVELIAVSKTKPVADILALYELGQRDFGENYVQELRDKQSQLPQDIRWHFIGHLQSNKVKFILPFVYMIHGVDSYKLLKEINKQAAKLQRQINCLLQVHIAQEETKFGFSRAELDEAIVNLTGEQLPFVHIRGLMGMASLTNDEAVIRKELSGLKNIFDEYKARYFTQFDNLSMGMSSDYKIAVEEGSSMVRIGSLLFGSRV